MPVTPISDKEAFARLAIALGPYLDQVVFIGGWLQALYLLHDLASPPDHAPLRTVDADIALPAQVRGVNVPIETLLREAGFTPEMRGDSTPPATRYHLHGAGAFYAEFIAHRMGAATVRAGKPNTTAIIGGVAAQKLSYIDILRVAPWNVILTAAKGYPTKPEGLAVWLANPASYLAHKILAMDERGAAKVRGKDILYVHDTLVLFGGSWPELANCWQAIAANERPGTLRKLLIQRARWFGNANDAIGEASHLAAEIGRAGSSSAAILATCRQGLAAIFG